MQTTLLNISQHGPTLFSQVDIVLSFKNLVKHIQNRIAEETGIQKQFLELALEKFTSDESFSQPILLKDIEKYKEQLAYISSVLVPTIVDERKIIWALSTPLSPMVFYGTKAFYNLITDNETGQIRCSVLKGNAEEFEQQQKLQMVYSFVLERLYGFKPFYKNELVHSYIDEHTQLPKYFSINIDTRFTELYPTASLPEINFENLKYRLKEQADWSRLKQILPLTLFRFEGFSVVTLTDITAHYALENLKNIILSRNLFDPQAYYDKIVQSLNTLVESRGVEFGLLPALRINNRLVFNSEICRHSLLVEKATQEGIAEETYLQLAENYLKNPKLLFLKNITPGDEKKRDFLKILKNNGVCAYALIPVHYNNHMVGSLEVYSKQKNILDEKMLAMLDNALPLVAQVLQNNIEEFNAKIEGIIKEQFTSVQPAVQWKFKEVAWHYLRDNVMKPQKAGVEKIQFKNVYPVYGAIDIRNSTIERNKALNDDLLVQFTALIKALQVIRQHTSSALAEELIIRSREWLSSIEDETTANEEMKSRDFFENDAHPVLWHFKETLPEAMLPVDTYFEVADEATGAAFAGRRALEDSIQTINTAVNNYLELFKDEIQQFYPCYFEKFRTDGIEYDIYMGQSIAPEKKFDHAYLNKLSLWQLTSMAAIARITHALAPQMQKHLQTTQLIFIHSGSIDISFRNDERRFDVEGAYNIRYHVIKKRIDKVHVKITGERLTQPGKIALIYFTNKEAEDYVGYINQLQQKKILTNELEYLELEELQGVSGLKALRVGIVLGEAY